MAKQKPIRPVTHADGSLITPVSKALRAAARRAGWDRDKQRPVNPVADRTEKANKR